MSDPTPLETVRPRLPAVPRTLGVGGRRTFRPDLPFPRLYRAHVEPADDSRCPERTAFVEAGGHRDAIRKIANAVAAIEGCSPEAVTENRIYNCVSAYELVDEGLSPDIEARLFETGWCGGEVVAFVQEPLFLLAAPAALIRKWAQLSRLEVFHE